MSKLLLPILLFSSVVFVFIYMVSRNGNPSRQSSKTSPTVLPSVSSVSTITPSQDITQEVPPPTGEDIIRTFFNLINEQRIPDAVNMLDVSAAQDDSVKQQWAVNFNSISSVSVKSIEQSNKEEWTDSEQTYKVILNVRAKSEQYGWFEGEDTRWVSITKSGAAWKIKGIATGP